MTRIYDGLMTPTCNYTKFDITPNLLHQLFNYTKFAISPSLRLLITFKLYCL